MAHETTHPGSCLCGAVTFIATGPLRDVIACHCTQCRRTSGHYWAATSVPLERFELTCDVGLAWFRSSESAERGFCSHCGASLFWRPEGEGRMGFSPAALDDDPPIRLTQHIYTEDAGDYYVPEGPPPAPVAGVQTLDCACLCGAVHFTLPGPAGPVTACHCRQCRKLSGHYSASFDADEARVQWLGRGSLATYATPGGGQRGFCNRCGSSLYFRSAKGEFSVEAGAVTGPTGGSLSEHIFAAAKAAYYEIDDGLIQS